MHIGIVCSPTYGGSGVVATELGLELAKRGHEVHFVSYERPHRLVDYADNVYFHEVSHDPYPLFHVHPYSLALASTLAEVIQERNLDILHVHYAIPHAISAILARQICPDHPFKLITTLHGTDISLVGQTRSYFPLTKLALEASDGVTAVSHYLSHMTEETFKTGRSIRVIHNYLDLNRFQPRSCQQVGQFRKHFPQGKKIVTHVSNFRPVKRVCDVVDIFFELNKNIESHLVLVGDGPDRGAVLEKVRSLGLEESVTFWGIQQAVEIIYAASDLFLLPSEHESFGLSALEALACGCPVVATSGSGVEEFITSGVTGELAPVGDVAAMAAGALRILKSSQPYRQAGLKMAKDFNLAQGTQIYEEYYREVLGNSIKD